VFYISWRWDFAFVMLGVSIINYVAGIKIHKAKTKTLKKYWLWGSVIVSLCPLLYLKYGNFFIENINQTLTFFNSDRQWSYLQVILPVGISFFTFQALSYALDIYYKKTEVEYNPVNFCVFVAFFPQLVAGPIERSSHLLGQFRREHHFSRQNFIDGSKLFIWGLFKKVVIADRLAFYVDRIYDNPELYNSPTLLVATLFFAIQIYCDFSGYSDMAIGTAKILGFDLMQNFNLPYLSKSISDFWKRWHISLSSWFGDYLYKPLGGNRVPYRCWLFNIFVVFLVSGFWHGASWTFIVWGFLHALFYVLERWGDQVLKALQLIKIKTYAAYTYTKILIVFVMVCYAWIYFRANSITDALEISSGLFTRWTNAFYLGASTVTFILSVALILLLFVVQVLQYNKISSLYFSRSKVHPALQMVWYVGLLLGISLLGISSNAFIYFQFKK
jgi:D-alanyl-lipoteichoic acid acyltransferase DltB (MBOAT superfamily)